MRILLVNTNPVISRLISWNTRSDDAIHIDEINGVGKIPKIYYDVVFIDEKCCDAKQIGAYLRKMNAGEKILFSSQKESIIEGIDRMILKPFLPSEITTVLQSILPDSEMNIEEKEDTAVSIESVTAVEEIESEERSVLDGQEIEIIKQLLLDEGLEVNEYGGEGDEMELENKAVEKNHQVNKKKKSKMRIEENLLESLVEMKPKKMRKLLEGAEVSITIKFPKEG